MPSHAAQPAPSLNWGKLLRTMQEVRDSAFMEEMMGRRKASGSASPMGRTDAALLYALTRWGRPGVAVETGGFLGMASSFILKAIHDEAVKDAVLWSIESMEGIEQGCLIPREIKGPFRPLHGKVEDFMKRGLPDMIDLFLHDSSHRYKHMLREFDFFFRRLRPGGLLISHDVNMNAAFTDFVTKTYRHDKIGQTDPARTTHAVWGRLGNLGFVVKS